MVDVLQDIKEFLVFESEDDFYFLQIIQRKKENPDIGSNSRVVKNYFISSFEYLEKRYEEIKSLCNLFNARAMLRLNKRSFRKVGFKTMQNIANNMACDDYNHLRNSYERACGVGHNDNNKKWILDLDGVYTSQELENIYTLIDSQMPEGSKVLKSLKTKNGLHLITKPFDLREFKKEYPNIEIHKDNPINLYIP